MATVTELSVGRAEHRVMLPSPWLQAVVTHIQDAIVLLDGSGRIVYESPSAHDLLGTAPDDVSTAFGLDRIHPEDREGVIQSFGRTIAEPGSNARATYRFRRDDGNWRHLEAVAKNLIDDPELGGVLITFRDVTDRILALESAERAGKARDEFLSQMSHELRTPLHAILGWAQLLEARADPASLEAAGQIAEAGHHLLGLVEEALDVAAVREGRITIAPRPVDVRFLCLEAIELISPLARDRDMEVRISPSVRSGMIILADPGRLRQVLINLLSNAVKFSRYGGEVIVGWTVEGMEGETGRVWIRDFGPGIPEDGLARLFERFERLGRESEEIEGHGLGLAISRRLVEMMGGSIGAQSRPGAGAEFWIRLPRPTPEPPLPERSPLSLAAAG